MRRLILLLGGAATLGVVLWVVAFGLNPEAARAYSRGIPGRSQAGCGSCHGANADPGVAVTISGPTNVTPGSTNSYTVSVSGGPTAGGGTDISVSGGTLAVGANTQLSGGELLHTNGSFRSWTFSWTAPATDGLVTMYAAGNSVNLDGGTGGDAWNLAQLNITVASAATPTSTPVGPTPTPTSTPVGPPGQRLYNTYCASCHERTSPGFVGETVYGESASDIMEAINEVRPMQFLRGVLTRDQINQISDYLRSLVDHERDHDDGDDGHEGNRGHEDVHGDDD